MTEPISQIPLAQLAPTARVEKLKQALLNAEHTTSDTLAVMSKAVYDAHEGEPAVLKRAYTFAVLTRQMPLYLRPAELLVGNRTPALAEQNIVPQRWQASLDDPRSGSSLSQIEIAPLYPHFEALLSEEQKDCQRDLLAGYPAGSSGCFGHIIAGYDLLLEKGASRIAREAAQAAQAETNSRKKECLQAMAIAWQGFAGLGLRYAALAERELAAETDEGRKAELREMLRILKKVPAEKPDTFYEALQAVTLMHFCLMLEQPGAGSVSMGGLDLLLQPYYEADVRAGRITRAFAEELMDSFYVKLMENAVWPRENILFANLSVGGRDSEGRDLTNDVSVMMLESTAKIRSIHPMLSGRWHPGMNRGFLLRVCELLRMGLGLPALFSDPVYERVLADWGLNPKQIERYGIVGCVEPAVMGLVHGQTLGGHVNLAMCLELALNDGKALLSQRQLGPHTGLLTDFATMDDLWAAYTVQVQHACDINADAVQAVGRVQKEHFGYPFLSGSMQSGIPNGKDLTDGAVVNYPTVCMVGVTNVADAMTAIEDLVFRERRIGKAELLHALRVNYEGCEAIRLRLLRNRDKFGNDSERAVSVFNRLSRIQQEATCRHAGPRGDTLTAGLWATTWHVRMGEKTGAGADGRKAREPLVDGIGAVTGRALNGPTAVANDVAKIDAARLWQGGYTFNMKFNRALLDTVEGPERLAAYIDTFLGGGGMQLQINTISRDTLLRAKENPSKYADLVVRVAGFSAYFCSLDGQVQDEIISRMEHSL